MSGQDFSKTFRILVASDIHLGYNERHAERGNDSFLAFEEVLSIAKEEDVDLLLLGGDLFHANKPSFPTLKKTIELLRQYCFGSRPIQFRIVSNQSDNFSHYKNFKHANYLDDNLNISLPVFTIHGNHDDPTGANHISALDSLSSAGLVNYFGKYTSVDEILLSPILLEKGDCKIALYGLGSVNEERLYRIVTEGKLNYCMPETAEDEWFKVVVVHQNRTKHVNTKYLPERFLSDLPNLVIWGHEHESRPEPDYNATEEFFVYQPGSTVATSLCEAEAVPKHCGILEVSFDDLTRTPKFRITTRKLKTVRPFIWESIDVSDLILKGFINNSDEESVAQYCKGKVEEMIQKASLEHTGDMKQPRLPLIRLRLEYMDDGQQFHAAQFGAQFGGRVANPSDIIHYVKRKEDRVYENEGNIDLKEMRALLNDDVIGERVNIIDIIKEYFGKIEDQKLKLGVLSENALTLAVVEMVEKESNEAIADVFEAQKEKMKKCLLELDELKVEDIKEEIRRLRSENVFENDTQDLARILADSRHKSRSTPRAEPKNGGDDDYIAYEMGNNDRLDYSDVEEEVRPPQTATRGASTATRSRARGRARGRGRATAVKREPASQHRASTQSTLDVWEPSSSESRRHSPRRATLAKKPKYEEIEISDDSD
ncbi:unnamed protein product [Medioppia subpectinata]|uniref:Double-strand break repair protein n=1 Tax=Medioppia subpectinata TaxID=1979941 RepID=A0A7R9PTI4_9ACAR|nr:unnamed protein product [Medioppia subpectinata]CAG2100516.1 unnamed protein product [Medioppia subpectinata]